MPATLSNKLLVRGVNWLGDAVMTAPALMRLREALPDTHVALLTRAKLADLWKSHPAINELIEIEPGDSVWTVGRKLRVHHFDTAVVLPNSPRSAMEVWLGRISCRMGYARPWRNWFLTQMVPSRPGRVKMRKRRQAEIRQLVSGSPGGFIPNEPDWRSVPPEAHQMHEYLHLVAALGANPASLAPKLFVDAPEIDRTLSKFAIPAKGRWLGVNAGAEYGAAKRWPRDRFVSAVRVIQRRTDCGVLVFGGPGDVDLAAGIAAACRDSRGTIHDASGRTTLRELMSLLTCCRVLLTNDTGPMHVAAALGVPVVVPFGSTSPELTGPGLPGDSRHRLIQSDAPCSPCFLRECPIDFRCMNGISVDQVVTAVVDAMDKAAA